MAQCEPQKEDTTSAPTGQGDDRMIDRRLLEELADRLGTIPSDQWAGGGIEITTKLGDDLVKIADIPPFLYGGISSTIRVTVAGIVVYDNLYLFFPLSRLSRRFRGIFIRAVKAMASIGEEEGNRRLQQILNDNIQSQQPCNRDE